LSAMASSEASVSRCSRSQERVNFITPFSCAAFAQLHI
jgi:hypothetical protein